MIIRFALAVFVVVGALGWATAQSVGALRQASWDLPANEADLAVVSEFFGAIDAVQTPCSESLRASLAVENALAACARLGTYFNAEVGRAMIELKLSSLGTWLSPWQENVDFGVVRRFQRQGMEYYLAFDDVAGFAFVVRFL